MKKAVHQIKLNDDEFKKIKKRKQSIILRLNNEDNKNIGIKDKVLLVNNKKKLKRKVKNLYTYSTIEELSKNVKNKQLGYKKKDIIDYDNLIKDYKKDDIKKNGLLGIEVKVKKHIFRKIVLGLIILVVLFLGNRFISEKINELKANEFNKKISEIASEKIDYVFIKINPYLLLSMRNGKVHAVTCLNQDCYKIYNDLRLEEKNINESIDIIYNVSKEKGFDTSNGVKVKTTGNIEIEEKEYVSVERISESTKDEIISNIEDIEIENTSNEDYYSKLWEELKKDSDYDKLYTCDMENGELACYLTWKELSSEVDIFTKQKKFSEIKYVLEKFGIKTEAKSDYGISFDANFIYIDDVKFEWGGLCDTHIEPINEPGASGYVGTDLGYYNDYSYAKDGKLYCITLVKEPYGLNLLNPSSIWQRARIIDDPMANAPVAH